ncbi:MAG: hypothetical protein ACLR4Z_13735 [Butyricicoccaceae bacterium]
MAEEQRSVIADPATACAIDSATGILTTALSPVASHRDNGKEGRLAAARHAAAAAGERDPRRAGNAVESSTADPASP